MAHSLDGCLEIRAGMALFVAVQQVMVTEVPEVRAGLLVEFIVAVLDRTPQCSGPVAAVTCTV